MAINQPQVVGASQGNPIGDALRNAQSMISDMLKLNAQRDQLNEMKRETNFKGVMGMIDQVANGYPGGYVALAQDMPDLFTKAWTLLGASPTVANSMVQTMQNGLMGATQLQAHSFAQAMHDDPMGTMKAIAAQAQDPNSDNFLAWTDNYNRMFGEAAGVLPGKQPGPQGTQQPGGGTSPQAQGQPQPGPQTSNVETPPPINKRPLSDAWWGQVASRYVWNLTNKQNPVNNIINAIGDTVLKAATGYNRKQIQEASDALVGKIQDWYQKENAKNESTSSVGTAPAPQAPVQGSDYQTPGSKDFQQQMQAAVDAANKGETPTLPNAPGQPSLYQAPVKTIQQVKDAVTAVQTNDPKLAAQALPTVPMVTLDVNGAIHYVGSGDVPPTPGSVGNAAKDRLLQKAWDALRTSLNTLPGDQEKVLQKAAPTLKAATSVIGQEVKQKLGPKTSEERATALDIVKFFNSRAGQQILQTPGERLQSRQLDIVEGQSKVEMMMKYFTLKMGQATDQGIPLTEQMKIADKFLAPYLKDSKFLTDSTYRGKIFQNNHEAEYAWGIYQKVLSGIFGVSLVKDPKFLSNFLWIHRNQYNMLELPPLVPQETGPAAGSGLTVQGQSYLNSLGGK